MLHAQLAGFKGVIVFDDKPEPLLSMYSEGENVSAVVLTSKAVVTIPSTFVSQVGQIQKFSLTSIRHLEISY